MSGFTVIWLNALGQVEGAKDFLTPEAAATFADELPEFVLASIEPNPNIGNTPAGFVHPMSDKMQ